MHELLRVSQFLLGAKPIESRTFALSLAGAEDLDQTFHLTDLRLCRFESCLIRSQPRD